MAGPVSAGGVSSLFNGGGFREFADKTRELLRFYDSLMKLEQIKYFKKTTT
jgi:hypothetical protein